MRILALLAAIALVAAGLWLTSEDEADTLSNQALPEELSDEPDIYLKNAKIRQFETTGTLRYLLKAQEIRHFERDASTRLLEPDLVLYDPDEPPWEVSSRRGTIVTTATGGSNGGQGKSERVDLTDDVRLHQDQQGSGFIDLRTEALTILPEQRIAQTDLDVMIDTNVGRTKAVGMISNLATGIVRLGSSEQQRVHTIVLPNQFR